MNSSSCSLPNSSPELVVSFGSCAPCLCNCVFFSGDILFFIGEMIGTVSMVPNR